MSTIYTSVDLGTDSIKIIVATKVNNRFHVLAAISSKARGIKNGLITDTKEAVDAVREAFLKIDEMLGIKIRKIVLAIRPIDCDMNIVSGSTKIIDKAAISGEDINNVLKDALVGQVKEDYELVTSIPINFTVDGKTNIHDPKGLSGEILETKVVITTVPRDNLYRILEVLKLSDIEVVDIAFTTTGDYYVVKNKQLDSLVGAIINIGEVSSTVSVYNKGIQIKASIIPVGSGHVDKDIAYIFKTSREDSKTIKEKFAVATYGNADDNEKKKIVTTDGGEKEISQLGIAKVVEARIAEILNVSKNEIKNLTKREISYIIVTGGLSELAGFQSIVEENLGVNAKVCNMTTMGIRHNKYSSALGVIKYFDDKLTLRGKNYNMIREEDLDNLISNDIKTANDNIISKLFGHFFDN